MLRRCAVLARKHVSAFFHEPGSQHGFDAMLKRCHEHDIDMASTLSSDFMKLQSKLIKYRIARLGRELAYVYHNPLRSLPSPPMFALHALLLPSLYWFMLCWARSSTLPLLVPPSPPPASNDDVDASGSGDGKAAAATAQQQQRKAPRRS